MGSHDLVVIDDANPKLPVREELRRVSPVHGDQVGLPQPWLLIYKRLSKEPSALETGRQGADGPEDGLGAYHGDRPPGDRETTNRGLESENAIIRRRHPNRSANISSDSKDRTPEPD